MERVLLRLAKKSGLVIIVLQATTGASKMVKSKSMEVMKAVQEDLGEVRHLHHHTIKVYEMASIKLLILR